MSPFHSQVDARNLNDPTPILMLLKHMKSVVYGEVVQLLTTDPGSILDIDALCKQTGHELVESEHTGIEFNYLIKKV